jgi:coenzyme F420-reducing hydrogenase beta subunit
VWFILGELDEQSGWQSLKVVPDEGLGVCFEVFSAKSFVDGGQDGGVVSALLATGLERGLFDCAVVVWRGKGYRAEAVVAETLEDILKASGTKYVRVNTAAVLKGLVEAGRRRIAVVGTPCQIRAARKLHNKFGENYPDLELMLIGLFCFEAFNYEKLRRETRRLMGIELDVVERTRIRKGKFIVWVNGKESAVSVKDLKAAVEKGCSRCSDFAAECADVSIGSVGSDKGYSTVIVRSQVGKKLVENLELKRGAVRKEEVVKVASLKKRRALGS